MKEAYNTSHAEVQDKLVRLSVEKPFTEEIENRLSQFVVGQPEAMKAIGRRLAMFTSGLTDPRRPLGAIMEAGPTGVGKTEAAKAAARVMFGEQWEDRLKIINCAEFQEKHTVARLTGSPPGYVGYTEKGVISHDWLHKGRSVIVFDEIEKAHPALQQVALSILEEGRIQARKGQEGEQPLNFMQSLIFFTTNVGSDQIQHINDQREIGFNVPGGGDTNKRMQSAVREELSRAFAPEFRNRLTDIVLFQNLEPEHYRNIFYKLLEEKNRDLVGRNIKAPYIMATNEMRDLVLASLDKSYGARNMRNVMDKQIFGQLTDYIIGIDLSQKVVWASPDEDGTVGFYTDDLPIKEVAVPEPPTPIDIKKNSSQSPDTKGDVPTGTNGTNRLDDPNDGTRYLPSDPGDEHQDKPPKKKVADGRGGEKEAPDKIEPPGDTYDIFDVRLVVKQRRSPLMSWIDIEMPIHLRT